MGFSLRLRASMSSRKVLLLARLGQSDEKTYSLSVGDSHRCKLLSHRVRSMAPYFPPCHAAGGLDSLLI